MEQPKGSSSVVRKAFLSVAVLVFMLVGVLFVNAAFSQDPLPAHAAEDTDAMRAEVEELRTLVQLLLTNTDNSNNQNPQTTQAGVPQISSQRAREIAVEFVGHGTSGEATLFTDNGVLTFEVDVQQGNVRYMVYVDAVTGGVTRMGRHEDAPAIAPVAVVPNYPAHQPTQPAVPAPTPAPTQQQTSTQMPPGVNANNFQRNVSRWGPPPSNPTRGTWWGSSYVWDGHRWNSSLS